MKLLIQPVPEFILNRQTAYSRKATELTRLTFVPCKIMEKITKENLVKFWMTKIYFQKNNMASPGADHVLLIY